MKVLLASVEIRGIYGTGGLGDVATALAKAVNNNRGFGFEADIIMPVFRYDARNVICELERERTIGDSDVKIKVPFGDEDTKVNVHVRETVLSEPTIKVFLLMGDIDLGKDPKNTAEEAVLFARSVCEFCREKKKKNDEYHIIHCNEWNTGLIPLYLKTLYADLRIKTLYTAHNAEGSFQGDFDDPKRIIEVAGLRQQYEWELLDPGTKNKFSVIHGIPGIPGKFNFLKAALSSADWVNTVSETYHNDLLQPNFGNGLYKVFNELKQRGVFTGILNGIDKGEWNPHKDEHLEKYKMNFSNVSEALETKAKLREKDFWKQYWLDQTVDKPVDQTVDKPVDTATKKTDIFKAIKLADPRWADVVTQSSRINKKPEIPIVGLVTRIDYQKTTILVEALKRIIKPECGFQFILMGEDGGDDVGKGHTEEFRKLNKAFPGNFLFFNIFDIGLSHLLYALIDIFVVSSMWEPCGLTPMCALKYGAPAVVRKTGGLSESVRDGVTGFHFLENPVIKLDVEEKRRDIDNAAKELAAAIERALNIKKNDRAQWKTIMEAGMNEDFSWGNPVGEYIKIYRKL
jgi:starch synthase